MRIKHFREKKNISQESLADQLSVDRTTITKWETGAAMPRADKLPEIARVLGCEVSDLFEKEG